MNVEQALAYGRQQISGESPRVDAEMLLVHCMQKSRTWLKTWPDFELEAELLTRYKALVERRQQGEPVAYIVGHRAFWSLELATDPSTLIPRPETELLVEMALDFLAPLPKAKLLDLGTGTGAIALAIASERPADQIIACDFNPAAVELAKRNALNNQLEQVLVLQSDWFSQVPLQQFNLIVSNPPYIAAGDPHLEQGDLVFEPDSALVSAGDGLADIRRIACDAFDYLYPAGCLMIEHGFDQGAQVRQIMNEAGYQQVESRCDLAGHERMTMGSLATSD